MDTGHKLKLYKTTKIRGLNYRTISLSLQRKLYGLEISHDLLPSLQLDRFEFGIWNASHLSKGSLHRWFQSIQIEFRVKTCFNIQGIHLSSKYKKSKFLSALSKLLDVIYRLRIIGCFSEGMEHLNKIVKSKWSEIEKLYGPFGLEMGFFSWQY